MAGSNVTYVRWRANEPRRGKVFPSLKAEHPCYSVACLLYDQPLGPGPVQLLALGDCSADETQHWHTAEAVIAHANCLDRLDDEEVESLVSELVCQEGGH